MTVKQFISWLKSLYPSYAIYNGTIPKNDTQCIGVYLKSRNGRIIAIGGSGSTSYAILPLSLLIHWGQDADLCEQTAKALYDLMWNAKGISIGGHNVIDFELLDSCPADIGRDTANICEMTIRVNVKYER